MKIFIDTANIAEIRSASRLGYVAGVTTNPSLLAKEQAPDGEILAGICAIVDGPVSAEVISEDAEGMVREAVELAKIADNIVIKIPMCAAGLEAVRELSSMGIKTNVTLIFSANQGLLAARAGATFVSPFIGRLDDIGMDGMEVVRDLAEIFAIHDLPCEIIAASIRHPEHVRLAALAGAQIATVPFGVLDKMLNHPLTTDGIAKFLKAAEAKEQR